MKAIHVPEVLTSGINKKKARKKKVRKEEEISALLYTTFILFTGLMKEDTAQGEQESERLKDWEVRGPLGGREGWGGGMLIDESHSVVRPEMIGFSPSPIPFLCKHTAVNSRIDRRRRKFAFQIPGSSA